MIKLEAAISIVLSGKEKVVVDTVLDIGHSFVISIIGENGEEIDIPPYAVDKDTGELTVFFPPDHIAELETAKEVEF